MGAVVTAAFALRWTVPVYVGEVDLLDIWVTGPVEALRYMNSHFKFKNGFAYRRAVAFCQGSVTGELHPEIARRYFVSACIEESIKASNVP